MSDFEKEAKKLASLVVSMNQSCDRSRLTDIELERLEVVVNAARGILDDPCEYDKKEDLEYF